MRHFQQLFDGRTKKKHHWSIGISPSLSLYRGRDTINGQHLTKTRRHPQTDMSPKCASAQSGENKISELFPVTRVSSSFVC